MNRYKRFHSSFSTTCKACLYFLVLFLGQTLAAQELKCNVVVVAPKIEGYNKKVFETMQTSLNEFMNGQKWTEHIYAENERIECTFLINIEKVVSADAFEGTMTVQARRPVYGSGYYTVLFNYLDDRFSCSYVEYQALNYNPNSYESNLISMMSFYANLILGFDYDSFADGGGTPYFKKAQQIVNQAQSSNATGWRAFENSQNRYWLVNDWVDEQVKPLRTAYYKYHRLGLDNMASQSAQGRGEIFLALDNVRRVTRAKPGRFSVQIFFTAKSAELINIFSEANSIDKNKALEILREVDPVNSGKYETALKSAL